MTTNKELELLAAVALADGGISLPLSLTFRRKPVRVTMKIPSTRSLIRVSRMYLAMGVTAEEYDGYTLEQKARFMVLHGTAVSRTVAYGILRGPIMGRLLNRPLAWLLRQNMHPVAMTEAWRQMLTCINTVPFGTIIASAEALNKMQPMQSHTEKRS
ncbi:hypothetical protein [Bacteroides ndongoniae]|uniref:hypothetical protein n=1 Tax=Bacteroides ndongoniae TaxID=1903262 RepID=UPI0023F9DE61|nr:hypothetical protein [Bacteroides ndongoniae]